MILLQFATVFYVYIKINHKLLVVLTSFPLVIIRMVKVFNKQL
jgi:hypothetical protein